MNQQEFFERYTYSVSADRSGGGGFGSVYKAYDNVLHRDVAIKVSEVKVASNGKTFSLKDEFDALSHVPKHPNIANYEELYTFESPQGVFDYAVMQYYPDGNLASAIKQGLSAQEKEDIAMQLLQGVEFLHSHKVVHRDLKPGNVLIVRHGNKVIPLITDFGLSKTANANEGSMFSNSFGGGTQRYSSPEQLKGLPLRFNTDWWSYGAVVYELFVGTPLFEASSSASNTAQAELEIYHKIMSGDMHGLGKMPEKWRRVVERCVVVDLEQRAKNADELLSVLNGATVRVNEETMVSDVPAAPADIMQQSSDTSERKRRRQERMQRQPASEPSMENNHQIDSVKSSMSSEPSRNADVMEAESSGSVPETQAGKTKGKRKAWVWLLVTLIILLGAGMAYSLIQKQEEEKARKARIIQLYDSKTESCERFIKSIVKDKDGNEANKHFVIQSLLTLQEIEEMEKEPGFADLGINSRYDDLFSDFKKNLREARSLVDSKYQRQLDLGLDDNSYCAELKERLDMMDKILRQSAEGSALDVNLPSK